MLKKCLPLLFLCGILSAADLPGGWKIYRSAKNTVQGTVSLQGKNIRVTDPDNKVENGITQTFDVAPGSYFRIRTQVHTLSCVLACSAFFCSFSASISGAFASLVPNSIAAPVLVSRLLKAL